jgi:hypothetical protein
MYKVIFFKSPKKVSDEDSKSIYLYVTLYHPQFFYVNQQIRVVNLRPLGECSNSLILIFFPFSLPPKENLRQVIVGLEEHLRYLLMRNKLC